MQKQRFDMFAGAQPIDPEIRASARKLAVDEIADLGLIRHPAGRMDFEIRKNGLGGIQIANREGFLPRPHPALVDFILIARPPIRLMRQKVFQVRLFFCRKSGVLREGWFSFLSEVQDGTVS